VRPSRILATRLVCDFARRPNFPLIFCQDTLDYSCVCADGQSPNASEYTQTIPYYICTQANNICVANCSNGDTSCQADCRQDHPCGAQNPVKPTTTSKSAMGTGAASTASGNVAYSGFGGSTATGSANAAAATLLEFGQFYGLGAVSAGIFAGFALLL